MSTFVIRLEVEGPDDAAHEAVEAALDEGVLQEAVNGYEHDEGAVLVKSAVMRYADQAPRKLTLEEVEVILTAEEETEQVRDNFATDEPELDRKLEDEIADRSRRGDVWAWFCAKVEVRWNGFSGTDYLGCCSYESEEDFRKGGYYDDMVQTALDRLNEKIAQTYAQVASLTA